MSNVVSRVFVLLTLVATVLGGQGLVAADEYGVDPVHSSVVFRIKHSSMNSVFGMFPNVSGKFSVDGEGAYEVTVGVDSIISGNVGRDRHLKSPDFFSARQFPTIVFKSTQVKRVNDKTLDVAGEVTLRGVTKPVTAKITTATGKGRGGEDRAGIETALKIKRSDFKLGGAGGLSDEVTVLISLQGVKK